MRGDPMAEDEAVTPSPNPSPVEMYRRRLADGAPPKVVHELTPAQIAQQQQRVERHKQLLAGQLPVESELPGLRGLQTHDGLPKASMGHTTITVDEQTGNYVVRYVVEITGPQLAGMDDGERQAFVERAANSFAHEFGDFWGVAATHAGKKA